MDTVSKHLVTRFRSISKILGWTVTVVSFIIMLEWVFFRIPHPALMTPLVAFLFFLSSIAFRLKYKEPSDRKSSQTKYANLICYFCLSVCAIKVILILVDLENALDEYMNRVFHTPNYRTLFGMAENTIINFIFTLIAILLIDYETKGHKRISQYLCFVVFYLALIATYGHIIKAEYLTRLFTDQVIALTTLLCFFLLAMAILLSRPHTGFMRLLVGEHLVTNFTMRLVGTLLPLAISFLRLKGEEYHLYQRATGTAIFAFFSYLLSLFIIGLNNKYQKKIRRINKEALDQLRWNELRLKTITENITEGVVIVRKSGWVFRNSIAKKMFGNFDRNLSIHEWPEKLGIYKPDEKTLIEPNDLTITNALNGVSVENRESFILNESNPKGINILSTGKSVFNNKGKVVEGILIARDITRRKNLEKSYYENSIKLRRILANSTEALVVLDNEGTHIYSNPNAEKILGKFPSASIHVKDWSHYFGFYYPDKFTAFPPYRLPFEEALKGHTTKEINLYVKNERMGKGKYITLSCKPVDDKEGEVYGVLITIKEV